MKLTNKKLKEVLDDSAVYTEIQKTGVVPVTHDFLSSLINEVLEARDVAEFYGSYCNWVPCRVAGRQEYSAILGKDTDEKFIGGKFARAYRDRFVGDKNES